MFLALGREGTRAALLRKPLKAWCPVGQTRNPQSGTWLLVPPTLLLHELVVRAHPSALQNRGKCVYLGLLGDGAHPAVDVGLPAGDRDEDPLLPASSLSLHILSCLCPIHPIQAVTLNAHTLPREGVTRTAHWPIDGNGF